MNTYRVPAWMQDALGEETTRVETLLIFGVGAAGALALFGLTRPEWASLAWWRSLLLFILIFDILAGFIANLTYSTNRYYAQRPRSRLIFIAIHVQPLIFAFLLTDFALVCLAVWVFTLLSAFTVNALHRWPAQRAVAAGLVMPGILGLVLVSAGLPRLLLAALVFYLLKVVFSFSVDHYRPGGFSAPPA